MGGGNGQMEVVTALLQQLLGAERNPQAADGGRPLYWAASKRQVEAVRMLLHAAGRGQGRNGC
jgi:hypothetical protein